MEQYSIMYRLIKDFEYEIIDTEDKNLNKLYESSAKYYQLPGITIRTYQLLGNFTLYLLGNLDENKQWKEDVRLQYLKTYLKKCISDDKYCNVKTFLSFIRFSLHLSNLPSCKCFANCNYEMDDGNKELNLEYQLQAIHNSYNTIELNKDYDCNSILEVIVASLFDIFEKGYKIKKCRSCDKFFVARKSETFCPYISPYDNTMSCLQYSRKTSSSEKRKNNPIQNQYNKVCNLLRKRINDAENFHYKDKDKIKKCEQDLEDFQIEYVKNKKIQYKNGEISRDEFLTFLLDKEIYFKNQKKEEKKNGSKRTDKK